MLQCLKRLIRQCRFFVPFMSFLQFRNLRTTFYSTPQSVAKVCEYKFYLHSIGKRETKVLTSKNCSYAWLCQITEHNKNDKIIDFTFTHTIFQNSTHFFAVSSRSTLAPEYWSLSKKNNVKFYFIRIQCYGVFTSFF